MRLLAELQMVSSASAEGIELLGTVYVGFPAILSSGGYDHGEKVDGHARVPFEITPLEAER
jgi:hypothetical protein